MHYLGGRHYSSVEPADGPQQVGNDGDDCILDSQEEGVDLSEVVVEGCQKALPQPHEPHPRRIPPLQKERKSCTLVLLDSKKRKQYRPGTERIQEERNVRWCRERRVKERQRARQISR